MNENEKPQPSSQNSDAAAQSASTPDAPTQQFPEPPAAAGAATGAAEPPAKPSGRKRGLLIGAAAVVALIAVGGSAYAIGVNVGDDDRPSAVDDSGADQDTGDADDDQSGANDADDTGSTDDSDGTSDTGDTDGTSDTGDTGSPDAAMPASDATALRAAAEKAIAETGAKGVTSIDVERIGYEVEVQLADGSEPDVRVAEDGTVTTETDRPDDDDRPDPLLDLGKLADIQKAALAAVSEQGGANGAIDSISSSDDRGVAYEVSVRLPDGRDADVELATDLKVVTVDLDD